MNIQNRYEDISRLSGLSEDIIRRVLKASRQSLAESLKHGERATLPGICTLTPEVKYKCNIVTNEQTSFIKIKAKASNSMTSELDGVSTFITDSSDESNNETIGLNFANNNDGEAEKIFPVNALL
jgi:hypothetical protein